MRRAAILLVCCLLLVLSWWRSPLPLPVHDPQVRFIPLDLPDAPAPGPALALEGAWQLESRDEKFGGYSGLAAWGDGALLAVSDRGHALSFRDPSRGPAAARMGSLQPEATVEKWMADAEAITRDPASGMLWLAYEHSNAIVRMDAARRQRHMVRPPAMRHWPGNSGPEAMVRLADGRFLVLSESRASWFGSTGPGLLFPGDPAEGAVPIAFRFEAPAGYRPTSLAQLPDGRVLVLVRRVVLPFPARFAARLLLADPALIRPGEVWRGRSIARFASPLPVDNFEGLAVDGDGAGGIVLWMISDDNTSKLQRTILLRLRWLGGEVRKKAHGNTPHAP